MPYKDPERRRVVKRASARRARERERRERTERVLTEVKSGAAIPLPDPPGRDELVRLLGEQARSGSVRAIELLLRMEGAAGGAELAELDQLDKLAQRRAARANGVMHDTSSSPPETA